MDLNAEQLGKALELGVLTTENVHRRTFGMTGRMSLPRTEMAALIRMFGGIAHDDGDATWPHYLIVGDTGRFGETNKIKRARQRGVRIITEADFVDLITPSESAL
jgi:NAD-dependent DNA ligase